MTPGQPAPSAVRPSLLRKVFKGVLMGVLAVVMFVLTAWAALAIYFADTHDGPRTILAVVYILATLGVVIFVRPLRRLVLSFAILFAVVVIWFTLFLKPSNDRDWSPDVAQLPWATIEGDRLALHNIRDFEYRSETDFTPRWIERTYDLSHLKNADFALVYWGSKKIAHAIVSFGFDDGQTLSVSIETRKEKGESYSAVQGFFRQYELYYVFALERDVIRLRTNFRNEEVYLYRTKLTPDQARDVLLSYVERANSLKDRPEFYNAATSNCATNILDHARAGRIQAKMSWEILLSGYAARQVYRNGLLNTNLPYEELEARSLINNAAQAASPDNDVDYSRAIRTGLPLP